MLDIKLVRSNPELVKENIKKKFQDDKLVLVDEVISLDEEYRAARTHCDELRNQRNVISKQIGGLMANGKKDEAEQAKKQVAAAADELSKLEASEEKLQGEIRKRMLVIPNIIDKSVPIGKNDAENVEIERYGEPVVPDFEVPYHVDIMERLNGIDLDAARRAALADQPGVAVHLYGKAPRPGRKIGHVTGYGHELEDVVARTRAAAACFG